MMIYLYLETEHVSKQLSTQGLIMELLSAVRYCQIPFQNDCEPWVSYSKSGNLGATELTAHIIKMGTKIYQLFPLEIFIL